MENLNYAIQVLNDELTALRAINPEKNKEKINGLIIAISILTTKLNDQ